MAISHFDYDIFVSYCPSDKVWAETKLIPRLKKAGLKVYLYNNDAVLGGSQIKNLQSAIDNSRHTLLVMTPAWLEDRMGQYVQEVASYSVGLAKRKQRMIPILLEPMPKLPSYIETLTPADFTGSTQNDAEEMQRLLRGVTTKSRVCLLHAPESDIDRRLVDSISDSLQQAGHEVYTIEDGIGLDAAQWLEKTITMCNSVIILLSQAAVTNPAVLARIEYAIQSVQTFPKIKLLPVRVDYTEALPDRIRSFMDPLPYALWTDENDNESVIHRLLNAIANFAELISPGAKGGEPTSGNRGKLWKTGQAIRIAFMDGTDELQWRIAKVASEWAKYANLRFVFCDDPDAEARITFTLPGSWSFIGTDVLVNPKNKPTMNFGWLKPNTSQDEVYRVVLHEFGHLLGMLHEHQMPNADIKWNKKILYEHYAKTNGWTKQAVETNIIHKYSSSYFPVEKEFDTSSIMMYPIPKEFTKDGMEVGWNKQISDIDKDFVARLYPYS